MVTAGEDVPQVAAPRAHEVMMSDVGVRVVAPGAPGAGDFEDLAHPNQLVQGVVHRCEADLGQPLLGTEVDDFGGEMHVLTIEDLGHDAALWREAPVKGPQSFE